MSKKLLLVGLICGVTFAINPSVNVIYFSTPKIGPFTVDQEVNSSVTYTFDVVETYYARFRVLVEYSEDNWLITYTSSRFLVSDGLKRSDTFPFPTYLLSESKPLGISYRIYNDDLSSNNIKSSLNYEIQLATPSIINIASLDNDKYTGVPYSLQIYQNQIVYYQDAYDFSYLGDEILEETYLYIDLRKIKFKYTGERLLTHGEMKFTFTDWWNNFPYLEKINVFTYVNLELEFDYSTSFYNFALADGYYVNPKTLEMSYTNRVGFIETDIFYLPMNKSDTVDGMKLMFYLYDMGYELNEFRFEMKYYFGKKLIGDCSDSDYCIVGELYD